MMPRLSLRLLVVKANRTATFEGKGGRRRVRVGEAVGRWVLRAAWNEGELALAAIESPAEIRIIWNGKPRLRAAISRPFGDLETLKDEPMPRFEAEYYEGLMEAREDTLGRQVLRQGEPSVDAVADLLPPVLDMTFLGDERAFERPIVRADGRIEGHFEAAFPFDTNNTAAHYRHGLLAGSTNAICYGYFDEESKTGVELIAFALADDASGKLAVYRRMREIVSGTGCQPVGRDARAVDRPFGCAQDAQAACPTEAPRHERSCDGIQEVGWEFYAALLRAYERDQAFFSQGAQIRVPERVVQEGIQASLRLGDLTFRGVLPRYGVGQYDQERHHSFPPSTIFLIWAHLEWGRLGRARELLSHYLSRRAKEDGTFDYYGPAVAEYGQMLALAARYVQLSGDREWWDGYLVIVRRIVDRLLALREESKQRNAGDVKHCGLIPGLPEADYHGDEKEWGKYYFAGDVWVCRGLREVGRILARTTGVSPVMGVSPVSPQRAEGERLIAESRAYEKDIRAAVRASVDARSEFVPAGPDEPPAFERMTESRHASYCNYRYLLEMVSAGILSKQTVRKIAQYRRRHGGELLGMTRFSDHLDDWPAWHYCRGLLDIDDALGYLMTFYGHLAHHHSRGNWASYEQVWISPDEGAERTQYKHAEQVVPCQVMAPIMLKHMLVDEDRDAEVLYLLRACPAAWVGSEEGVSVQGVPTRWGPVSFKTRRQNNTVTVQLHLDFPGARPEEVRVRLALADANIKSVRLDGKPDAVLDRKTGSISVGCPMATRAELRVEFE